MQIVGRMRFVESLKGKPMSTVKVNELVEQPDRRGDPQERYLGLRPLTDYFEDGRSSLYVVVGNDPKEILEHSFFGPLDQDPKEIAKVLKQVVALDGKPDAEWIVAARDLQGSRSLFAAYLGLAILKKKNQLKINPLLKHQINYWLQIHNLNRIIKLLLKISKIPGQKLQTVLKKLIPK